MIIAYETLAAGYVFFAEQPDIVSLQQIVLTAIIHYYYAKYVDW